jgi:hypothetical protein
MILQSINLLAQDNSGLFSLQKIQEYLQLGAIEDESFLHNTIDSVLAKVAMITNISVVPSEWCAIYSLNARSKYCILPRRPVLKLTAIRYFANNKTEEIDVQNATLYGDKLAINASLTLGMLEVNFKAGYTNELIPANLKSEIYEHIRHIYLNKADDNSFPLESYNCFKTIKI